MRKIYYLKTCDTCRRILKSLPLGDFELQEIKSDPITVSQLEEMYARSKSYQALFSKRSKKYTSRGLKNEVLTEIDYRQLILEEYTFLKRPVIIIDHKIYIGSDKNNLNKLAKDLN